MSVIIFFIAIKFLEKIDDAMHLYHESLLVQFFVLARPFIIINLSGRK